METRQFFRAQASLIFYHQEEYMKRISLALLCGLLATLTSLSGREAGEHSAILPFLKSEQRWSKQKLESFMLSKGIRFSGNNMLRTAFLHNRKIFGVPAVEMRVSYDDSGLLSQIDIFYANKGDTAKEKNMGRTINHSARELAAQLTAQFGESRSQKYGLKKVNSRALAWMSGETEIFLEHNRREYVIIHILFRDKNLSAAGKEKINLKDKDFSQKVKENSFGDRFIADIPMVNQGSKGYCAPATVERVLRYYGITTINMHFIADKANTRKGGGTSVSSLLSSLSPVCRAVNLRTVSCGDLRLSMIKKYIDQGIPIFWVMRVNPEYEKIRSESRRARTMIRSTKEWVKHLRRLKVPSKGGDHICLVIGYNAQTEEIAVSNSWGEQEIQPSWVPLRIGKKVSHGKTFVLVPR